MRDSQEEVSPSEWLPNFIKKTIYSYFYTFSSTVLSIMVSRFIAKRLGYTVNHNFN